MTPVKSINKSNVTVYSTNKVYIDIDLDNDTCINNGDKYERYC